MKEKFKEDKIIREVDIEAIIERKLAELINGPIKPKEEKLHHHPKSHHDLKSHHHLIHKEPIKLEFEFDEKINTIINVFGDESTAEAIIKSLKESPIEIQVLAQLIIDLHERLDEALGE